MEPLPQPQAIFEEDIIPDELKEDEEPFNQEKHDKSNDSLFVNDEEYPKTPLNSLVGSEEDIYDEEDPNDMFEEPLMSFSEAFNTDIVKTQLIGHILVSKELESYTYLH